MIATSVSLDCFALTDTGRKRQFNEDAVLAAAPVFLVADGMGGHDRGDKASALLVEEMGAFEGCGNVTVDDVCQALARAAARISALGGRDSLHLAGTTVSGLVLTDQHGEPYWLVVNLGDSRTYHLAQGRLHQVSVDHSEVQEMVDAGKITRAEARTHPNRNVVTRVLGAGLAEKPDYWLQPAGGDERWLICSDGLSSEVDDQTIERLLLDSVTPEAAARALVAAALAAGGRDNVSVIVVDAQAPAGPDTPTLVSADDADDDEATLPTNEIGGLA
jgi:protein phosphatase